ncbi:acyl carrier protein [Pseudarthrobacter sp. RMG13]|uniref:Acyl carrier protein n=1 Tax=Pseudarthrobacter humi TaxID=2952523 RepID=A0ABT1LLZ2_9MICC|nr:acyl carrier protein [Pseudarthrobacter humi]MCP8999457.1 acyl carrier protein [Pseudarthrobacter humi]
MTTALLKDRISEIIEEVSSGSVTKEQALDAKSDLTDKGFTSLSFLQLIDAVETELGVYIDLEGDTGFLQSVDGIAGYVHSQSAA